MTLANCGLAKNANSLSAKNVRPIGTAHFQFFKIESAVHERALILRASTETAKSGIAFPTTS